MRKFHSGVKSVAVCAIVMGVLAPASAQITYKSIPLDGGGWFSGYATHPTSGRIYGFGDVFGAWRSDNGGDNWTYPNRDMTINDQSVTGMAVDPNDANANRVAFKTISRAWRSNDGGKCSGKPT